MTDKRRVYGYARVSTRGQAEEGISLEAQEARIRAFAIAKGWELIEVLVDAGKSAKNMRRPMLDRIRRESFHGGGGDDRTGPHIE